MTNTKTRKQFVDFGCYPAKEAQRIADEINRRFDAGVIVKPVTDGEYATVQTEREVVIGLDRYGRIKGFCDGIFWADCH